MNRERDRKIPELLRMYERELLADWLEQQRMAITRRSNRLQQAGCRYSLEASPRARWPDRYHGKP